MKVAAETSPLPRLLFLAALPFLGGALWLARLAPAQVLAIAHCPLRETTGLPCPTCGTTLALTRAAAGEGQAALAANPLAVVLAAGGALLAVGALAATVVPRWRYSVHLGPREKRTARWLAVLLILLNWSWLIWRYSGRGH